MFSYCILQCKQFLSLKAAQERITASKYLPYKIMPKVEVGLEQNFSLHSVTIRNSWVSCLHMSSRNSLLTISDILFHSSNKYHHFCPACLELLKLRPVPVIQCICEQREYTNLLSCCIISGKTNGQVLQKTVGAGQKAQEWVCSSGGATGLCLWHYQFCSPLPTKLWLMKSSSPLISISLFIFIMAKKAHRNQGPWWTNNTPASCLFCPLSLIWRESENSPMLIAIWSTA